MNLYTFELKKITLKATPTYRLLSRTLQFLLCLALLALFEACTQYQHADLEPRPLGWQPDRDLAPYHNADSMIGTLDQVRGAERKLDSLLEWTDLVNYHDEEAALKYANEAYRLAVEKGSRFSQAVAMYYRALLKERMQIIGEGIEDALADAIISQKLTKSSDDPTWLIRINGLLGKLYFQNRRFYNAFVDSAHFYSSSALETIKNAQLRPDESAYLSAQQLGDLADIYNWNKFDQADSSKAIEFLQKSIQSAEISQNQALLSARWRAFGNFYLIKRNFPKADSTLIKSKNYALASGDQRNIVYTYQKLGDLKGRQFLENRDTTFFNESMYYLRNCLSIQKENLFYTYLLIAYNFGDKFYIENGDPPNEYSEEGDSAIFYYMLAIEEAKKEGALGLMDVTSRNIVDLFTFKTRLTNSDYHTLLGDKKPLLYFLTENYAALVDTTLNELQTANLRMRQFERKELMDANKRRIRSFWFTVGGVSSFVTLLFLLILQRQQQQKKVLRAEMSALRAQINPHFISNSLNAIENLVNRNEGKAAAKYLTNFSRLSRKILKGSRNTSISLAEELQILEHFLTLEQLRFREKLFFDIQVMPDLNPDLVEVPALILQPFVENAIWHGIQPKTGPGQVLIQVERKGKHLICMIEDDGIGREESQAVKTQFVPPLNRESHGIRISEERLKTGNRADSSKVEIIDLYNTAGNPGGTRVIVTIPLVIRKNGTISF